MTPKTVQDYVNDLLYVGSVRSGEGISLRSDMEAYDILDQISMSMYLYPDSALYFFMLARNSLIKEIDYELALVDQLSASVQDSINVTFSVSDHHKLQAAESSITSASYMGAMTNAQLSSFSSSVDKFLKGDIRRNVYQGTKEPRRPGQEAVTSIPQDLASLKAQHSVVLDRYHSLVVSIKNFMATNFASTRGPTVLNRIKAGVQEVMSLVKSDGSGASSRDTVNRLIAYKSVLTALSSSSNLSDLVVDTSAGVPTGYEIYATSPDTPAIIKGSVGPYSLSPDFYLSITDGNDTTTAQLPVSTYQLGNKSRIVGTFPSTYSGLGYIVVTVEASESAGFVEVVGPHATWYNSPTINAMQSGLGDYWIKSSTGAYTKSFKVPLSSCTDPASILAALKTYLFYSDTLPNLFAVAEYPKPSYGKFTIIGESSYVLSISVSSFGSYVHVPTGTIAYYRDSSGTCSLLGILDGASASPGPVPSYLVIESINALLSDRVTASLDSSGYLIITGKDVLPGAFLSVTGSSGATSSLGITSSTENARSEYIELSGKINGEDQQELLLPMTYPGDSAVVPTGIAQIQAVEAGKLTLSSPVRTFSGQLGIDGLLRSLWSSIQASLESGLKPWSASGFQSDLESIDRKTSIVLGGPSSASVNSSMEEIDKLRESLVSLRTSVYPTDSDLPDSYRSYSIDLAKTVIQTLAERKMDRAVDLLLSGKIQEVLLSDANSLSYATKLSKSIEDVARAELTFIDTGKTDKPRVRGTRREYG